MRARLAAFLPALQAANERLPAGGVRGFEILGGEDGRGGDVAGNGVGGKGGEGQYIEMVRVSKLRGNGSANERQDLGLGVLEALNGGEEGNSSEGEDEDADESVKAMQDDAILDTLMGKRPKKRRKLIDEV